MKAIKKGNIIRFNFCEMNKLSHNSLSLNSSKLNSIGIAVKLKNEEGVPEVTFAEIYAIYNVDSSDRITLLGDNFSLQNVKSMAIDGVDVKPIKKYAFPTTGEHEITMGIDNGITSTAYMFYDCEYLTMVDLSQLDTSNVTYMGDMFYCCSALTTIPLLDTSSVTNMNNMFSNCSALTSIPQLDTSNVTDMGDMFYRCFALTTIPLLDTSNVISMAYMFNGCPALENLGGFKNCKVALDLSSSPLLTHDSLMNVINNLYDLTANGLLGEAFILGSTNLAKLTADEIAIATNKGWTVN